MLKFIFNIISQNKNVLVYVYSQMRVHIAKKIKDILCDQQYVESNHVIVFSFITILKM